MSLHTYAAGLQALECRLCNWRLLINRAYPEYILPMVEEKLVKKAKLIKDRRKNMELLVFQSWWQEISKHLWSDQIFGQQSRNQMLSWRLKLLILLNPGLKKLQLRKREYLGKQNSNLTRLKKFQLRRLEFLKKSNSSFLLEKGKSNTKDLWKK